jgi:hypothetical protein
MPLELRHAALLLMSCLPVSGQTQEPERPPEFVADQKADRLYKYYLDAMMDTPSFYSETVTFRIANNIWEGGDGKTPEFYLMTMLHVDKLEIVYPRQGSIYSSIYQYFLDHPAVSVDELNYWPATIHKRFTFDQCPEIKARILAVEQYIRTSLVTSAPYRFTGLHYRVGYTKAGYELSYEVSSEQARPVPELLEIRDIALRCAQDFPTVEEVKKAEELRRKQEQAEFIKNFEGPLLYSPPPIVLKHGGKSYESAIGASCWGIGSEVLCDDVFASVTPRDPIVVRRGDRVHFEIPEPGRLEEMDFALTRVTDRDVRRREEDKEFTDIIIWEKEIRERPMSEAQRKSITVDKPPGNYILTLHGAWADYGDAAHGFYLKVN